jgi:hypothetical protein
VRLRWGRWLFGLAVAAPFVWWIVVTSPSYGIPDAGRHLMSRDQTRNTLRDRFQLAVPFDAGKAHCEMEVARAGSLGKDVTYLFGCRLSWTAPEMSAWLQRISQDRAPDAINGSLSALHTMHLEPPFEAAAVYASSPPGQQLWGGPTVYVNEARTEAMAYYFEYLAFD